MDKLELAKEKIKQFYIDIFLSIVKKSYYDEIKEMIKFKSLLNENRDMICYLAAKDFEINYSDNESVVSMVADTTSVKSLNAFVMFMSIDYVKVMRDAIHDLGFHITNEKMCEYLKDINPYFRLTDL